MRKRKTTIRAPQRLFYLVGVLAILVYIAFAMGVVQKGYNQFASVFFVDSSTPITLHNAYINARNGGQKFKVLIVPGHDDTNYGTWYSNLREADLTLEEGKLLARQFASDPNIEVRLARTEKGFDPEIAAYLVDHAQDIKDYRSAQETMMKSYLASGAITQPDVVVDHVKAISSVALQLYGINKWANEQKYQLVIHVHFNDTPRRDRTIPGVYRGFAVYVPHHQFSNAKGSLAVASAITKRLADVYPISSMPKESAPPTEDQQLIAIGSNNSLDAASLLVEYAYIYEPQIQDLQQRPAALQRMAQQTYWGVEDFLNSNQMYVSR